MKIARLAARVAVGAVATALATTAVAVPAAQAGTKKPVGTKSLAQVLLADKSGFDHNPRDFDVLTKAVLAVLEAKPDSPVKVLTDGTVALTAFIPNDAAFQQLVREITDARRLPSESAAFTAVAGLGIDTVETVLLYHVVPGATIDRKAAVRADGAELTTALGATVEVDVRTYWHYFKQVRLIDADTDDRDPRVVRFDVNKGNKQIAHAVDRVLRPIDLP
ncbi:fasciclin domain-containing protein [Micromonospora endolithica]|uniref:Fasciclin domain-containing protein n=1 Tax=Micromonospora endolithica TaxID=230091 RepID=A0A3A9ZI94_9ACTN|nr:fasciclin domain-containing protein [Micromonospora endolithica]RKN47869.1 fasciclin domain-containing protein [Micromonospora endolithica]TWJ21567.1 putative surface protein with fasciclin (FAS1) repeats [Micromonospora endolithica]